MWMTALILLVIIAMAMIILLVGSKVSIKGNRIKMEFRTYTRENILRHRFSVKVCNKSPAEYDTELAFFIPRIGAPPSRKKKWAVAVEVFDCNGQYIRKHLFQKPSERAAEKLAMELKRGFASQLIQAK